MQVSLISKQAPSSSAPTPPPSSQRRCSPTPCAARNMRVGGITGPETRGEGADGQREGARGIRVLMGKGWRRGKQSQAREVVPVWYCRRGTVHSTGMHLLESNCKQDRILLSCVQMNAGMAQGDRLLSDLIKHLDANRSQLFLVRFRKMKLQAVVNRILFRI